LRVIDVLLVLRKAAAVIRAGDVEFLPLVGDACLFDSMRDLSRPTWSSPKRGTRNRASTNEKVLL
jgi:hypothetical protein